MLSITVIYYGSNDTGIGVPGIGQYWPVLWWIGYWAIFFGL